MAHFAELNEDDLVLRVVVIKNEVITKDGKEVEQLGIDFLNNLLGGSWKQTSYNAKFRKNFAGVGMKYDRDRDAFIIISSCHPSWVFDEDVCQWLPPTPHPDNGVDEKMYYWNEETVSWKERVVT